MRRTASRGAKFSVLAVTLALVAGACSIQAPDVIIGNPEGGGGVTQPGQQAIQPGQQAIQPGQQAIQPGQNLATDTSCVGKATAIGVTPTQIKLGATFAASGPVSNISGPILKGVQAYFNKVNAEGGVFNRQIFLKWEDDGWDAQKGKGLIKKLVEQDKVFVMTVVPSSNGLDAARTYLESKRMPVFGTSGLIESQFRSPMQWPVGTATRSAARIGLLDFKRRGVKNMAMIWLDLLAGSEAHDATLEGIQSIMGVKPADFVTSDQRVSLSEADFGPVWARIQQDTRTWQTNHRQTADGRPDFVAFLMDPTNAIKALQAAQNSGFKPKKGWGGGAPLFLNLVSQTGYARQTGLLAGTAYFPPQMAASVPAVQDYIKTVQKYYGSSVDLNNPYLEGGYAGAALTVEILKRAGSCLDKDKAIKVANSLSGFSPAGLTQPLTYTATSHYGNLSGLVVKVQANGQWAVDSIWYKDPTPGK